MAVRHPDAPRGYAAALTRRLQDVVMTPTGSAFLGWKYESPPRPRGIKPQPVYHRTRDDVRAGDLLPPADAVPDAWRSLIQMDGDDLYAMELGHPADDAEEDMPLLNLSKGRLGRATAEAMAEAGRLESDEALETRILKIPALYFMALWLEGPRGHSLLPLEDHGSGLRARKHYAPEDVLEALQPFARAQSRDRDEAPEDSAEMN